MAFRYLTSGESHGKCLNLIIDGFPSGVFIDEEKINNDLKRRQSGYGRGGRMKIETDKIKFNSGIRHSYSIGSPICAEITNKDWENWSVVMSSESVDTSNPEIRKLLDDKTISKVRPGHADFAGALKYNQKDIRNILERSSARETTTRVAAGAICKCLLEEFDIDIFSHVLAIGNAKVKETLSDYDEIKSKAELSEVRCADEQTSKEMIQQIDNAQREGVTLGGYIEVVIRNLPIGLGSHIQWDKRLDGILAQAIMSIPAVKSVEIGAGVQSAYLKGSDMHDEIFSENGKVIRKTNNAGGLEGGMTNGEPLIIRAAMKAIPTMRTPLNSINLYTKENTQAHFERSDTCAVPACAVVAEAMAAIALTGVFLEKFSSDNLEDIKQNYKNYQKRIRGEL